MGYGVFMGSNPLSDDDLLSEFGFDEDNRSNADILDFITGASDSMPSDDDLLLSLFEFGEDERSNADILAFLADAKENDYQPTIVDMILAPFRGSSGSSGSSSGVSLGSLVAPFILSKALGSTGMFDTKKPPVGYQGSIPKLKATREQITGRDDTDRRPGSGGRRYFSDVSYTKEADTLDMAAGGLASLEGGGYLEGDTDGQADLVPADIDGVQEARLSHGEYVLPADLVAILGNGNSDAGAKALDEFMSTVRKEATGTPKQQKNIDADKALQILMRG
tara:strand:- start:492 stop:1325 length:834 start_codon:yes stop_codon:yes gene_type:complete